MERVTEARKEANHQDHRAGAANERVSPKTELLGTVVANQPQHCVRVDRLLEVPAQTWAMEQLRDVRQGMKVTLELALRDQEEHHQGDGLVIQGIEGDALLGAPKSARDLRDQIAGRMGDPDAKADARAHRGLAFSHDGADRFPMLGLDTSGRHQTGNQFVDRLPTVGGFHLRQNLLGAEDVTEVHTSMWGYSRSNGPAVSRGNLLIPAS